MYVKAYTRWMLNFDTLLIYKKGIHVIQNTASKHTDVQKAQSLPDSTIIRLFPEGGFAVEGLHNGFGFCATSTHNMPVAIRGVIKNEKGEIIDSAITKHDGMGFFRLQPKRGETYTLEWRGVNGSLNTKPITIEKKSGACLHVVAGNGKAEFAIERSGDASPAFSSMHLLDHKNYSLWYKMDLNLSQKQMLSSNVSTLNLPAGIVQFTLFDADWIPVAERIIFVRNNNYSFHPQLTFEHAGEKTSNKKHVDIFVPDTAICTLSVSVVKLNSINTGEPTIFSDFLLTDELKGTINNPAYYFPDTDSANVQVNDSIAEHLDLVMLTHGYRRYDWEKIAKGKLPLLKYAQDTSYLSVAGKLTNKKMISKNNTDSLTVMLPGKDKRKMILTIPVEKDGSFSEENFLLSDTVQAIATLQGNVVKSSDVMFFSNDIASPDMKADATLQTLPNYNANDTIANGATANDQRLSDSLRRSATLREVVVKTRVKSKMQVLDEYYTHGVFSGDGNNYNIDVEGDIHAAGSNIWIYLQSQIPGLQVGYTSGEYVPAWFPDARGGNLSVPALFLDEVPARLEVINDLSIENIAYVKAFPPPFVGAFLNGLHGAISIYSQRGYSPVSNAPVEAGYTLHGYTVYKEFSQNAFSDSSLAQPDINNTDVLYFNPFIITDKDHHHAEIDFYNKPGNGKTAIIVEGINTDGRMAREIKIVD